MPRRPRRASGRPRTQGSGPPPAPPVPTRPPQAGTGQVYGCAALCALGSTVGLLRVLLETNQQLPSARAALALCGIALSAGVVLGFTVPRRIIRRHLSPATPAGSAPVAVEFEFAASLTGLLLMLLALLWVGLCACTEVMESYRTLLTREFVHPPWLTRALLLLPVGTGILLLGATGTTALVVLQGWYRLLRSPSADATRVWITILAASAAGSGVAAVVPELGVLDAVTLLCAFGAAGLAVVRRSRGKGPDEGSWEVRGGARGLAGPLVSAGGAAAVVAFALVDAAPMSPATMRVLAGGAAAVSVAAAVGVVLGRAVLHFSPSAAYGALLALLMAIVGLAAGDVGPRLAIVGCAAAAAVVLAGQQVVNVFGRVQPALVWIGGAVAGGHALGLAVAMAWLAQQPVPEAPGGDGGAIRAWVRGADGAAGELDAARAWDIDLGGPQRDAVLLRRAPEAATRSASFEAAADERILRRCRAALRPGGRLIIELPADELAAAAFRTAGPDATAHLLHLNAEREGSAALVFGTDIPAWVAARTRPDAPAAQLTRVRDATQLPERRSP